MIVSLAILQHNPIREVPSLPAQAVLPMSVLRPGACGKIVRIDAPDVRLALLSMGVSEGDDFRVAGIAPLGGPLAIMVRGTKIFLRKDNAAQIWISA
ncbi:MAG: hypothetical protein OHK0039_37230 [Bacteroidia bacterium]